MIREKLRDLVSDDSLKGQPIPKRDKERMDRGRDAMMEDAAVRRLCLKFWRGETNWFVNAKGLLQANSVVTNPTDSSSKPPHRIRNRHNFIEGVVQNKVSQATQRVPSYQNLPTTPDPDDIQAAALSEQVALYGYDKWNLRRATIKAVEYALVTGEGFLLPYFDPNVGPFSVREKTDEMGAPVMGKDGPELEMIGQGEMRWRVFFGNQVYWEPGVDFNDSPWWAIEEARPADDVEQLPGFCGGTLVPDANTSDVPTEKREGAHLVLVTEYFERPCPRYPEGRRLIIANNQVICPPETYPCRDGKGRVVDEPVLHRLSWTVDPELDRDRSLVLTVIDLQRTIDDCWNKLKEWKNRCLNPQMIAPRGSNLTRRTDEPGAVTYYNPVGGQKPEWERPIPVPQELFQMLEKAQADLRALAADTDVQPLPDVAAKTISAALTATNARWDTFMVDLADWHSRVMRHYLQLTSQHYSEDRLLQIQGTFSPDMTDSFRGTDLRSQINVRVLPQSLQPLTAETIEARATNWATMQWISPPAAMTAIMSGTMDGLMLPYKQNVNRISRVIGWLKQGIEVFSTIPRRWDPTVPATDDMTGMPVVDPMTGQPQMGDYVPGWMPRPFDNVDVQLEVFETWLGGADFERLDMPSQEAAYQVWEALKGIQQQREVEQALKQTQMAVAQGAANAARPQLEKPMPDTPKPASAPNAGQ